MMGELGQYTGLDDKDGTPIHIGQVIRITGIEGVEAVWGRVWFNSPELVARRVEGGSGQLRPGSYSLVNWGYGKRVQEFTVVEPHPGATWSAILEAKAEPAK
jgi:hypothetical protein